MNPSQAFWKWYDDLPASQKDAIAQIVMTSLPDYPARFIVDPGRMEEDFKASFSLGSALPSREVARLRILRGIIDFFVVRRMKDQEQWEKDKAFWEYVIKEHPEHAQEAKGYLMQIPFQSAMWRKTCENWEALCEGPLGDEALRRWMDEMHLRKFAGWESRGLGEKKSG